MSLGFDGESFLRGIEEQVNLFVGVSWGVLQGNALGLLPTSRSKVAANRFADGRREQDVAVEADEMRVVGVVRYGLDVLAVLAHSASRIAQTP